MFVSFIYNVNSVSYTLYFITILKDYAKLMSSPVRFPGDLKRLHRLKTCATRALSLNFFIFLIGYHPSEPEEGKGG